MALSNLNNRENLTFKKDLPSHTMYNKGIKDALQETLSLENTESLEDTEENICTGIAEDFLLLSIEDANVVLEDLKTLLKSESFRLIDQQERDLFIEKHQDVLPSLLDVSPDSSVVLTKRTFKDLVDELQNMLEEKYANQDYED